MLASKGYHTLIKRICDYGEYYYAQHLKDAIEKPTVGMMAFHEAKTRPLLDYPNHFDLYKRFLEEKSSTVNKLKQTSIKSCVHIMNSLPYETKEMMLETARWIANCKPDAIKIHMLHILQGTQMALQFFNEKFSLLSIEDYVDIVIRQLEVLPPDLIIERLTGDGMANDLIEPQWTIKKTIVLNEIDKEMVRRNTWQGKYYKK